MATAHKELCFVRRQAVDTQYTECDGLKGITHIQAHTNKEFLVSWMRFCRHQLMTTTSMGVKKIANEFSFFIFA